MKHPKSHTAEVHKLMQDLDAFEAELAQFSPRPLEEHQLEGLENALKNSSALPRSHFPWKRLLTATGIAAVMAIGCGLVSTAPDWGGTPDTPEPSAPRASAFANAAAVRSPQVTPPTADTPATTPAHAPHFETRSTHSEIIEVVDEGLVTLSDSRRMRQLRTLYLDTITLEDPETQATMAVTFPREETILLAASSL